MPQNSTAPTEHQEKWWGRQPCRRCNALALPDNRPMRNRPICPDCDGSGWTVWAALATEPFSEIVTGLYVGGHDFNSGTSGHQKILTVSPESAFDVVISMYVRSGFEPDKDVTHHELLFHDGHLTDEILVRVAQMSEEAAQQVESGCKVLCRCQAGLNRASLVAGMTLIWLGYTGTDAVQLIRARRSPWALCNEYYEDAVLNMTISNLRDLSWRQGESFDAED